MVSVLDWIENIVGKGENAAYQHFLLFPQCFPKRSPLGPLKVGIVWYRVKSVMGWGSDAVQSKGHMLPL